MILNGIDLNRFKRIKSEKIRKLRSKFANENDFLMLSAENITKQKGHHLIIKVLPEILKKKHNVKLLIVGGRDYLKKLKNMVTKSNLKGNVFLRGESKEKI